MLWSLNCVQISIDLFAVQNIQIEPECLQKNVGLSNYSYACLPVLKPPNKYEIDLQTQLHGFPLFFFESIRLSPKGALSYEVDSFKVIDLTQIHTKVSGCRWR